MTIPSHAELLREYLEQLSQPGSESRLPAWKDWRRLRLGGAMALGAALSLVACDSDTDPQGNQGGTAGATQVVGTGGLNMTALYAVAMVGGSTNAGGVTSVGMLYAAPMVGGASNVQGGAANTGGMSAGVRYAVPLGGNSGDGGQPSAQGGNTSVTASGGFSAVALYAVVMESGGASSRSS